MDQEDINRLTKDEEEFLGKASALFVSERESAIIRERVSKKVGETQFGPAKSLSPRSRILRTSFIVTGFILLSLITYMILDESFRESEMPPVKKAQSSEMIMPEKQDANDSKLIADTAKTDTVKNMDDKPKKKKKSKKKVLEPVSGLPVGK